MKEDLFVTGIGTEVGKTIVSAVLVEALGRDYWKPVQAGELDHSDTQKVKEWVSREDVHFHPEAFRLERAMSPHAAADKEGIRIFLEEVHRPLVDQPLVIEGAGGLMVPLNGEETLVLDLIRSLQAQVVLVSRHYLGSINHTLLSWQVLQQHRIPVKGVIFSGNENRSTEEAILDYSGMRLLGRIEEEKAIGPDVIRKYADQFRNLENDQE